MQVQETSEAVTKLNGNLKDIFKKSLKQNRWDPITFAGDHEFTNDAVVARWQVETGKWHAVRKIKINLNHVILNRQKENLMQFLAALRLDPFLRKRPTQLASLSEEQ